MKFPFYWNVFLISLFVDFTVDKMMVAPSLAEKCSRHTFMSVYFIAWRIQSSDVVANNYLKSTISTGVGIPFLNIKHKPVNVRVWWCNFQKRMEIFDARACCLLKSLCKFLPYQLKEKNPWLRYRNSEDGISMPWSFSGFGERTFIFLTSLRRS